MTLREDILSELESGIELQGLSLRERVESKRSTLGRIALIYGWYMTLADMVEEGLLERRAEEVVPTPATKSAPRGTGGLRYFYKIAKKG